MRRPGAKAPFSKWLIVRRAEALRLILKTEACVSGSERQLKSNGNDKIGLRLFFGVSVCRWRTYKDKYRDPSLRSG